MFFDGTTPLYYHSTFRSHAVIMLRPLKLQHFASRHRYAIPLRRHLSLSSVRGPTDPPLDPRTLPDYFASHILPIASERLALICRAEQPRLYGGPRTLDVGRPHLRWTFAELDRHVAALARGLLGMGVKKGERVGVVMGNNR